MRFILLVAVLALLLLFAIPLGGANCHACARGVEWPEATTPVFRLLYQFLP